MNILPMDKITKVSKPQADALNSMAEAGIKLNNSQVILIAVAGAIVIIQSVIKFAQNHDDNKHEERMTKLELEKLKIEYETNKEEE